jgi:agmatine/peptidylarginine deiminase
MLRRDPELARRSSSYALGLTAESLLREMLIGIVEDQLDPSVPPEQPLLDEAARQLTEWGFRVVRVPHLSSGGVLRVSYVNSLLVGRRLFMPTLGLGRFEERMFAQLTSELSGQYEIIPVDARRVLMLNGGLHCVFGILRQIEPSR